MNLEPLLPAGCSPELSDRTFLVDIEAFDISSLECAVVFYLARWSGQCLGALRMLSDQLLIADAKPIVIFVDADAMTDDARISKAVEVFGATPHGYGEVCWILGGKVLAQDVLAVRGPSNNAKEREALQLEKLELIASRLKQLDPMTY